MATSMSQMKYWGTLELSSEECGQRMVENIAARELGSCLDCGPREWMHECISSLVKEQERVPMLLKEVLDGKAKTRVLLTVATILYAVSSGTARSNGR